MRFTEGERVKVRIPEGNADRTDRFVVGTVVSEMYVMNETQTVRVSLPKGEVDVPNLNVYKYTEVESDEVLNQYFLDNIDKLAEYIRDAWGKLFPAHWGGERVPMQQIVKDRREPYIKLLGGTIEIRPGIFETKGIGRINEFCGYTILTYKHHPGDRWTSPEDEDIELATVRGEAKAAAEALKHLWLIEQSNYWEHVGECEYAEELMEEG